jgi:hypothetical protein
VCKLTCDPTSHASRPTGDDSDFVLKSSHLSEDYDAFLFFEALYLQRGRRKASSVKLQVMSTVFETPKLVSGVKNMNIGVGQTFSPLPITRTFRQHL